METKGLQHQRVQQFEDLELKKKKREKAHQVIE
jgi:hypothetical protein